MFVLETQENHEHFLTFKKKVLTCDCVSFSCLEFLMFLTNYFIMFLHIYIIYKYNKMKIAFLRFFLIVNQEQTKTNDNFICEKYIDFKKKMFFYQVKIKKK